MKLGYHLLGFSFLPSGSAISWFYSGLERRKCPCLLTMGQQASQHEDLRWSKVPSCRERLVSLNLTSSKGLSRCQHLLYSRHLSLMERTEWLLTGLLLCLAVFLACQILSRVIRIRIMISFNSSLWFFQCWNQVPSHLQIDYSLINSGLMVRSNPNHKLLANGQNKKTWSIEFEGSPHKGDELSTFRWWELRISPQGMASIFILQASIMLFWLLLSPLYLLQHRLSLNHR